MTPYQKRKQIQPIPLKVKNWALGVARRYDEECAAIAAFDFIKQFSKTLRSIKCQNVNAS